MTKFLSDTVSIEGRFLRSVRIDRDDPTTSLEGYVFPASLKNLLCSFAEQQNETGQGAYIWTGPYGSGKSSLALALSALMAGSKSARTRAADILDTEVAQTLWATLPPKTRGWRTLPMIGNRGEAHQLLFNALNDAGLFPKNTACTPETVIAALEAIAQEESSKYGGLIVVIDEMGKILEHAAAESGDVYFFQLLAEAAARSNGRLIVIGILHQSFQEYANRLGKEMRDEWAKIQGRFSDVPVNLSGEEQIELIARAIHSNTPNNKNQATAEAIASLIRKRKPAFGEDSVASLVNCWPLHPATTCILGPVSRRSYGQNQRSIFSFLSSAEIAGFQDFLRRSVADTEHTFLPADLWDYLNANMAAAIASSRDSHHFSTAHEAIDVCTANAGTDLEISILKTVALLELVSNQSGLVASREAVKVCHPYAPSDAVLEALEKLQAKKFLIFKDYRGSFGIYQGSDFDIQEALEATYRALPKISLSAISGLLPIQQIVAKRHYHQTGTYRYCAFEVVEVAELEQAVKSFKHTNRAFGLTCIAIPTQGETQEQILETIKAAHKQSLEIDLLIAAPAAGAQLFTHIKEQQALKYLLSNRPELKGDGVARREVIDRRRAVSNEIISNIWKLLDNAEWHSNDGTVATAMWAELSIIVSDLADKRFNAAPIIHNELINRAKPSGSANAALKLLLHGMVLRETEDRLGIEKHPAEWGLYASIIEANGLHGTPENRKLTAPKPDDRSKLAPAWEAAKKYLAANSKRSVLLSEIYEVWGRAPYGINPGLMPLLAVLFIMTERSSLAFYREQIFLSRLTDLDVDYLLKAPELIQLRWMDLSDVARDLLAGLADVAADLTKQPVLDLEPIDVARALIAAFDKAPSWVQNTTRLSKNAIRIRTVFKKANDPNKFIFDDIPALYANEVDPSSAEGITYVIKQIKDGLGEILDAYSVTINRLQGQLLTELQVLGDSDQTYADLKERALNIKGLSGDLRLEAFVTRLASFDGSLEAMESVASLAVSKPPKDWLDTDLDQATVELVNLAQRFNKHETVARIKGRPDKREAMAIVVGMDGRPVHVLQEFDIMDSDKDNVAVIANKIEEVLKISGDVPQNILLAALATVSAKVIGKGTEEGEDKRHA